ncbi:signal peptidase II [bacterium]|nr:signal peptidase II [bacterium]RQV97952.1 MAG: signal peptidase II [bacterium]
MIVFIFISFVLIADQLTKHLVRDTMVPGQSIPVLGDVVRLTYVENPGIAFGIRVSHGWIFTVLSILASIGIIVYLITQWKESGWIKSSLALILGGAVGNLIDRIAFSRVADFVDIGIGTLRWPVFNVADSAVVIGMFMLFITMYMQEKKRPPKKVTEEESACI